MVNVDVEEGEFFRYDSWYAILLSALLWSLSYYLVTIGLPEKNAEYCCRILSFWHGVITAFVGINQCFDIDTPFEHPEWRTTRSQKFLMVCSLGYFIHDLHWCLRYESEAKLMIAHHVYSVCALTRMLFKTYSGAQTCCSLGTMEITNPMLQIRWFLRSEGFYPSTIFTAVEITFMLLFFVVRVVFGTYFVFLIMFQPKNDWDFKVLALTIYAMSWAFMVNIVKYFICKYGGFGISREELSNKGT